MHKMVKTVARFHARSEEFHREAYALLKAVNDMTKKPEAFSQEDRADLIYYMKHIAAIFDDIRKEAGHNTELLEAVLCAVYIGQANVKSKSVRGNVALATPQLKMQAHVPSARKEPVRYAMLMRALGVTDDSIIERGLLSIHWPTMVDFCTELSQAGKPLPDGIDPENTKPKYSTSVRKRTDVDLKEIATDDG